MFNYREGFRREDDILPDKFFENKFMYGDHKGAIVDKNDFHNNLTNYYKELGWDVKTSKPNEEILKELSLDFTV